MDTGFTTLKQSSPVTLPMELVFSCILPNLPAKSLLRFKCVSKSFLTEISSPKFDELFSEANCFCILPGASNTFRIYKLDSPHSRPTICACPMPPSKWRFRLLACCESYLLTGSKLEGLVLFNPITRIYRMLPKIYDPSEFKSVRYGMCHCLDDEFNEDFKVARFVRYDSYEGSYANYIREVNIYSLRTNFWRTIKCETATDQSMGDPVLVQNHLLVMIFHDFFGHFMRIGCFDIKAERWSSDVLLPDIISGEIASNSSRCGYYYLGILDGKLRFSWYDDNKLAYNVWVMKKYDDKSSWVKLMSLPLQGPYEILHPIAYRKGSSHELLCISNYTHKCYWYSLRDKQSTEAEFKGSPSNLYFAFICKGSLSNFPGGQPICSSSKYQKVDDCDGDDG